MNRFLETYLWSERGNLTHKATERLAAGGASQGVTLEALSYDLNDRLTVADAGTAGVERFAYDGAGNRLNDPAGYPVDPAFNGYDSCNRLIRQGPATGQHVELSYVDPSGRSRGNIVSRTLVDGAGQPLAVQATYSWTQDNLLTGVARPGFSAVSYRYDAEGARVTRQAGGAATRYLFSGLEPVLERRADGSADYYVYAVGRQVGRVTTNGLGGQETVFFHADYLASVRAVTDVTGAVVWSERYRAFGSPAELAGATANPYRFTGKCWDEEAGLFYFQARWMDPAIGRFLSEDPLWGNINDPQSLNRFAYGRNNPFRYTDPTGMETVGESGIDSDDFSLDVSGMPGQADPFSGYSLDLSDDISSIGDDFGDGTAPQEDTLNNETSPKGKSLEAPAVGPKGKQSEEKPKDENWGKTLGQAARKEAGAVLMETGAVKAAAGVAVFMSAPSPLTAVIGGFLLGVGAFNAALGFDMIANISGLW